MTIQSRGISPFLFFHLGATKGYLPLIPLVGASITWTFLHWQEKYFDKIR